MVTVVIKTELEQLKEQAPELYELVYQSGYNDAMLSIEWDEQRRWEDENAQYDYHPDEDPNAHLDYRPDDEDDELPF